MGSLRLFEAKFYIIQYSVWDTDLLFYSAEYLTADMDGVEQRMSLYESCYYQRLIIL